MQFENSKLVFLSECKAEQLLEYRCNNLEHLKPWEPLRKNDCTTLESCDAKIKSAQIAQGNGNAVSFALFNNTQIIGIVNFTNITGFPFRACYMGFSIDLAHQGKGCAQKMLVLAIDKIFQDYQLNRIMANFMPKNHRSGRLLFKLGFSLEGFAYRYLEINGIWEDHYLTSLLQSDWSKGPFCSTL